MSSAQDPPDFIVWDCPQELNSVVEGVLISDLDERLLFYAISSDDEVHIWILLADSGNHIDYQVNALSVSESRQNHNVDFILWVAEIWTRYEVVSVYSVIDHVDFMRVHSES